MPDLSIGFKGAWQLFRSIDLDESEEEIKGTPGHVGGWHIWNDSAAVIYVHFYNATAANVTVGTTTPVLTLGVETLGHSEISIPSGLAFDTAITVAATTAVDGTGAPAANDCVINVYYY